MDTTRQINQKKWQRLLIPSLTLSQRIAITIFATVVYILLFFIIYPHSGSAVSALVVIPVITAGWLLKLRGGLIAGMASTVLNVILYYVVGLNGLQVVLGGGIFGAITTLGLGTGVGWASSLVRKLREQSHELELANAEAIKANQLKSEFLSKVSHDLRTPLGAIWGYADLLHGGTYGPVTEKQQNKLKEISNSAKELAIMVNDLLDMSRIEAGKISLNKVPFEVAELANNIQFKMASIAEATGITLTTEVAPDMPASLIGDPVRISQVLTNLVDNAIKYTNQGTVKIHIYMAGDKEWALQVVDTGIGIPPEAQSYVFESFRQVDGSNVQSRTGVGLGLAIVKELTSIMGGRITLESEVGKGSTFTVILPVA